jgi:hypothetical protein
MTGGLLLWICVAGIGLLVLLSARPVGRPRLSLHRRLIQLRPDRPEGEPQPRLFGSPGLDSLLVPGLRSMGGASWETAREAVLGEDAALIRMMGMPVLEALPSRGARYEVVDPFILVHEGRFPLSALAGKDTKHSHRGFDNLSYLLKGTASTGHSTDKGDQWNGPG